jgi:hypothetical protein
MMNVMRFLCVATVVALIQQGRAKAIDVPFQSLVTCNSFCTHNENLCNNTLAKNVAKTIQNGIESHCGSKSVADCTNDWPGFDADSKRQRQECNACVETREQTLKNSVPIQNMVLSGRSLCASNARDCYSDCGDRYCNAGPVTLEPPGTFCPSWWPWCE